MQQLHGNPGERESPRSTQTDNLRPISPSNYGLLISFAEVSDPSAAETSTARNVAANQALTVLTRSIQAIVAERNSRVKTTFRNAVGQSSTELLPQFTSDIQRPQSGPEQQLEQALTHAITEDVAKPLLRRDAASAILLLEYIDRQMELEKRYPGISNLIQGLENEGFSIAPQVKNAFECTVSISSRVERLKDRLSSGVPARTLLASAFLTLPAIIQEYSLKSLDSTLRSLQSDATSSQTPWSNQRDVPVPPRDFYSDLCEAIRRDYPQYFESASILLHDKDFQFAARLNAGRYDRILRHISAFCVAIKNQHGISKESIAKECIQSLAQEFRQYRDDFIIWGFPLSNGAADAIREFEDSATANRCGDARNAPRSSFLNHLFQKGFTPPDPASERLNLCTTEPKLLVLGGSIRENSKNLLPILCELVKSQAEPTDIAQNALEPLRLFLLGYVATPLVASLVGPASQPDFVRWVSLHVPDLQSFGGLKSLANFNETILTLAREAKTGSSVSKSQLTDLVLMTAPPFPDHARLVNQFWDLTLTDIERIWETLSAASLQDKITTEEVFQYNERIKRILSLPPEVQRTTNEEKIFSTDRRSINQPRKEPFNIMDSWHRFRDSHRLWRPEEDLFRLFKVKSLQNAGFTEAEIQRGLSLMETQEQFQVLSLLTGFREWNFARKDPSLSPPAEYLLELATLCPGNLLWKLEQVLSQSDSSLWSNQIPATTFIQLFEAVFSSKQETTPRFEDTASWDRRRRLLATLVDTQRSSSRPLLQDPTLIHSLTPEMITDTVHGHRHELKTDMCRDRITPQVASSPIDLFFLGDELQLSRFQPRSKLETILSASLEYLSSKHSQAPHRLYPSKDVTLNQVSRPNQPLRPLSLTYSILKAHRLLFEIGCEQSEESGKPYLFKFSTRPSPAHVAAAIGSLAGQFFLACSKSPFERGELQKLFQKIDRLDSSTLARYIERLVNALDGGFYNTIPLTIRNQPLARAIAKDLKLDLLIKEFRCHYDSALDCKPDHHTIDVTFLPTISWLMEVSGAITGSCVGRQKNIAKTFTEGVFIPFVVKGQPPRFSGGAFVFEGVLANGEKVMVIRGFNPRRYLLNNVLAGELFEKFADYVGDMGRACGAKKVVLPHANFWHNPATIRPDVHLYFQNTYMHLAPLQLGECQVRRFNNLAVNFVVEVRKIRPS